MEAHAQFLASGLDGYIFGIKERDRVIAGREVRIRRSKGMTYAFTLHKFVLPRFEGQGLAQMVSKKMEDKLRQLGCKYIVCLVSRSNSRAVQSIALSGYRKATPSDYLEVNREFASDEIYEKFLE